MYNGIGGVACRMSTVSRKTSANQSLAILIGHADSMSHEAKLGRKLSRTLLIEFPNEDLPEQLCDGLKSYYMVALSSRGYGFIRVEFLCLVSSGPSLLIPGMVLFGNSSMQQHKHM